MAKNKFKKYKKLLEEHTRGKPLFSIPEEIQRLIWGILLFLGAIVIGLSFFDLAGIAGKIMMGGFSFLIGKAVFSIPFICLLVGLVFLKTKYKRFLLPVILAFLFMILGISGILGTLAVRELKPTINGVHQAYYQPFIDIKVQAGRLGYVLGVFFSKLFGFLVSQIIFVGLMVIGVVIFWQLLKPEPVKKVEIQEKEPAEPSLIKKIFAPKFKVKEIEPYVSPKTEKIELQTAAPELKTKSLDSSLELGLGGYKLPLTNLLEPDKENPSSGDTRLSSAIIKKTLQNFDIPVEMSEINIGPTVTQYTLKPYDGIKLSKITILSNDLSLALAAHPIRIEAPIPGRSLVGIEIPNKVRARVRLRNLIENPNFQNSPAKLQIVLGRDVSGVPLYADLSRMPHLLVAGSTGSGKTIFLNTLILSLLYKNSPESLRLILVDPKRVEFPVYEDLPHLLAPVIFDAVSTCNALKWLIGEMERRFDVLAKARARDILSYNETVLKIQKPPKNEEEEVAPKTMPYILLIIDELADLMAAKGRDMEAGVVRLAQMARAVGIHLVLATQRPSVEVITGLIKANITSRITFQVASQIDSRTVLDMAGAEKLLGLGDMLFVSSEIAKPKRIQGAYVSDKEVRKVMDFIKSQSLSTEASEVKEEISQPEEATATLAMPVESLKKALEAPEGVLDSFDEHDDPLYEEAKRVVIESRKASASLLQRRLRVGYARAARLIDLLEERRVVGPGEGAKPREVYLGEVSGVNETKEVDEVNEASSEVNDKEQGDNWQKV